MTFKVEQNYIVYSPPFDENVGGIIFLHQLVHELNALGENAFLWPFMQSESSGPLPKWLSRLKNRVLHKGRKAFALSPHLNTPLALPNMLHANSIIVYPELILGNPLNAPNVVRWLLYKPGLKHPYEFGDNEMYFRVGEMFDLPEVTGGAPDLFLYRIDPAYRNENRPEREGVCYIVRKGDEKARIPETEIPEAIQIDGKSHSEINEIFNRCHTFYSYDEATMYSEYAAVCGCTSIVIPGIYGSREEWVQNHNLARFGVAYGLDDTAHAIATRGKVLGLLREYEAKGQATVKEFVRLTKQRFK